MKSLNRSQLLERLRDAVISSKPDQLKETLTSVTAIKHSTIYMPLYESNVNLILYPRYLTRFAGFSLLGRRKGSAQSHSHKVWYFSEEASEPYTTLVSIKYSSTVLNPTSRPIAHIPVLT